jgi:hypothetical protein
MILFSLPTSDCELVFQNYPCFIAAPSGRRFIPPNLLWLSQFLASSIVEKVPFSL